MPFLCSHVSHIALNKQVALPFVLSGPQEIHGLQDIGNESLVIDQLMAARWMILTFTTGVVPGGSAEEDHRDHRPWSELGEYKPPTERSYPSVEELNRFTPVIEAMQEELRALGDRLWSVEDDQANAFRLRLCSQILECARFSTERVRLVKQCSQLPRPSEGDEFDLGGFADQLGRMGSGAAGTLMGAFGGFGMGAIGPIGYLLIKNQMCPESVFAGDLLAIVRGVVRPEALRRGYVDFQTEKTEQSEGQD